MSLLQPAIDQLAAFGLASGVQRSAVVYAVVSATHVLGIALLVGPVVLADLRLVGLLRALDVRAFGVLRGTAALGALLALSTGVMLLSAKPADYAGNWAFWAKLAVVGAGLANALRFEWLWRRRGAALLDGGARNIALTSLALWLAALLLGRWIAFVA